MKTHTQLVNRFFAALLFSTLVLVFPNSPTADKGKATKHKNSTISKSIPVGVAKKPYQWGQPVMEVVPQGGRTGRCTCTKRPRAYVLYWCGSSSGLHRGSQVVKPCGIPLTRR